MRPFRELIAWQKAHSLTVDVWGLTATFPSEERFVLVPQMRRAARSMPANIAEGSGRESFRAFRHHVDIACGSCSELESDLQLTKDLGILASGQYDSFVRRVVEVRKTMMGLARLGRA